ncbi:DNA processing protein [Peptoclostridium litorale DSM 5388]|uniref:Protein Smf n=1 Tax=Peptoclostridium litorale DSM 5388 TaxID=1121324 RepID=A0A069RAU6_PEPLI|nr:DNA-processing protein DprA [Peptoclostridium litorale]KDR94169.1 protein Smf [Peptoclostridium litorale DSM 5388]SIN81779.1 DNA processing protein [Peptoclostridium litorale DSM 5388]
MDKSDIYLLLWCIDGVGYKTIRNIEEYIGDINKILDCDSRNIRDMDFISEKAMKNIIKYKTKTYLEDIKGKLDKYEIGYVTVDKEGYPGKLKNIFDPPYVLFYKGNRERLDDFSIAIVGARRPTGYGSICARKFSKELSEQGVSVVSGMAFGIDSCSHEAAMAGAGKTVAVLGSSLDRPYPIRNKGLMERIIENNGTVISEYPPETDAIPGFFPMRNRIISGISNGVLVVEAAKKSGSLITMDYALEQGKNVFAVPGNINSRMSEGTNSIIKEGAKLVTCAQDILEEYGIKTCIHKREFKENVKLSKLEKKIVDLLETNGSMHVDIICASTGICIKDILGVLNILQIKGIVLELGGNVYSVTI